MLSLLSGLIVSVIFHGGTGGQEHSCSLQRLCTPSCSHVTISESIVLGFEISILKLPDAPGVLHFEFRTLNGFLTWLEAFAHSCVWCLPSRPQCCAVLTFMKELRFVLRRWFGQELTIDSEGSWAVDEFQIVDNVEISLFDADDHLPDGTAWFGFSSCAWFRCPSCAIAAFLLWVQLVAKG